MRKLIASIAAVGVMAFAVPAFAEITTEQQSTINNYYNQIHELRKQAIDQSVAAGELTQEQAETYKTQMDERKAYREANGIEPGAGMGLGRGKGSRAGLGKGAGMGMGNGINRGAGCYYQVPAQPAQ